MAETSTIPTPKVTKISASKLLGRDSLEKRVEGNAKKITLLKNIIKARKITTGKKIADLSESTRSDKLSPLQSTVQSIAEKVNSIQQTLLDQQEFDKKTGRKEDIEKNQQSKKSREGLLESKAFKGFMTSAQKVLAPVKSLFDRVLKFITTIILGRVVFSIIKWWSNPANEKKVQGILKFIGDYWPALTAGFLLFGTGLGSLVANLTRLMLWAIPKMIQSIAFMMRNPIIAAAILAAGGVYAIGKMMGKGEETSNVSEAVTTGVQEGGANQVDVQGALPKGVDTGTTGGGNIDTMRQGGLTGTDPLDVKSNVSGVKLNGGGLVPPLIKPKKYVGGGKVTGRGGVDNVPARLTAGEFVMSKGAVNKWGAGTLAAMNSIGGGTNRPTYGGYEGGGVVNTPGYEGGGMVSGESPTKTKNNMVPLMLTTMAFIMMSQKNKRADERIQESVPNQTVDGTSITPPSDSSKNEPKVIVIPQEGGVDGGETGPAVNPIPPFDVGRGEKHVREVLGLVI